MFLQKLIESLSPKKKKEVKDEMRACPFEFARDNGGLELDAKKTEQQKDKVEFISTLAGLEKWAPIVPQNKAIPEWFKTQPGAIDFHPENFISEGAFDPENITNQVVTSVPKEFKTTYNATIKTCVGMHDYFKLGYIMPLWCDVMAETSLDGNSFFVTSSLKPENGPHGWILNAAKRIGLSEKEFIFMFERTQGFHAGAHSQKQYEHLLPLLPDEWTKSIVKVNSPWQIKTPKGWSMFITEPFFNFNPFVTGIPGIIDTDYYHIMNFFWIAKVRGLKWKMDMGMPIEKLIPIKRDVHEFIVREANLEDMEWSLKHQMFTSAKWSSSDRYKKYEEFMSNDGSKVIQ
jgi:hypothetical protein